MVVTHPCHALPLHLVQVHLHLGVLYKIWFKCRGNKQFKFEKSVYKDNSITRTLFFGVQKFLKIFVLIFLKILFFSRLLESKWLVSPTLKP